MRIRVRANGAASGAALKIGADEGIATRAQLVERASALLLTAEQRASVDVEAARLYLDGGDEADLDLLDKDDVVFVAFGGEPFKTKAARLEGSSPMTTPAPATSSSWRRRSTQSLQGCVSGRRQERRHLQKPLLRPHPHPHLRAHLLLRLHPHPHRRLRLELDAASEAVHAVVAVAARPDVADNGGGADGCEE